MNAMMRFAHPRLDADGINGSAFLNRELEHLDPTRFMELYAGLRARRFVPPITSGLAPYDKVYTYTMWGITGEAKAYGQNAKDLPRVGVTRKPSSRNMQPIAASFGWTIDDIRAAAAKSVPLDEVTVIAATSVIERRIDTMLAFGDADAGFTGLVNDDQIATDNTVANVGNFATAANKLDSLNKLVADTRARLKLAGSLPNGDMIPAFDRFQILLSTKAYSDCKQTPASANYPQSVLQIFLENNSEWVSGVSEWSALDKASGGTKQRGICYPLNPAALGAAIAREFTQEPPQANGMNIDIPCHASCGGTVIRYPVAFSYMTLEA
jgi:hypothetical protein